jgi:hypothetical protein
LNLKEVLKNQEKFSKNFYDKNQLNPKQKEELLKTLCLGLQQEVSQIVSSTNFKVFDKTCFELDKNKITFGIIDVIRYVFAMSNLYDLSEEELTSAYKEKENYLNKKLEIQKKAYIRGTNVIVFDVDDVICEFRSHFNKWLEQTYNIIIDKNSKSYYSSKEVKSFGLSPELVFEEFISSNKLLSIPVIKGAKEFIDDAKSKGYYIQLLTSRPESNLKCKYQTYMWLKNNNIYFDDLSFTPEKYIWLAKKEFFLNGDLAFAIDDSPKHAMEYSTHDVKVVIPDLPYNKNVTENKNVIRIEKKSFFDLLGNLI